MSDFSSLIDAYFRGSSITSERAYQVTQGQVRICPHVLIFFIFILFFIIFSLCLFQLLVAILAVVLLGSHLLLHQKMVCFMFSYEFYLLYIYCIFSVFFYLISVKRERPFFLLSLLPGVPDRLEAEVLESVNPPHCSLEKTLLHGYPFKPTCITLDPVQKILAIGNKFGQIRFLGKPGIDLTFQHESRSSVIKLVWVVNTGQILSVCKDDCLYLLDVKQRQVEVVQFIRLEQWSFVSVSLESLIFLLDLTRSV